MSEEFVWNAHCLRCPFTDQGHRLVAMALRQNAELMTVQHFQVDHGDQNVIIQGVDFTLSLAPARCDVCNVVLEPPFWEYAITARQVPWDADGKWAVCDGCHLCIGARDEAALVARARSIGGAQTGVAQDYGVIAETYGLLATDEAVIRRETKRIDV